MSSIFWGVLLGVALGELVLVTARAVKAGRADRDKRRPRRG